MPDIQPLDRHARVYIAGHNGLAGSAIWRAMEAGGFTGLVGARSSEVDLRDRDATFDYLNTIEPEVVVLAAARVGGIAANETYPAEFLSENLRIQVNVMDAARELRVDRLLFLGSSCIYPKLAEQPIKETSLLTGALEPTNEAYAIAKIAGIMQVQAVRKQDKLRWISAMPTNLYGTGDNYDPESSHVLAALIRRFYCATEDDLSQVTLWGTGAPRREFLHADDLGLAVVHILDRYDDARPINVGVGEDISIRDLAAMIAEISGFKGSILFDSSRPDGTPRKLLDVSRIHELGWRARTSLRVGVESTYHEHANSRSLGMSLTSGREDDQLPLPVLTVVTICRNELAGLKLTVESVQAQEGIHLEHIVIDAASSDGSPAYLATRRGSKLRYISEPDNGRYDAMNKGAGKATGQYLWFMHAGDQFANATSAKTGVELLRGSGSVWGYGLSKVMRSGEVVALGGSVPFNASRFLLGGRIIPHQASIVRRDLFSALGGYDTEFGLAEDQHFFVRALRKAQPAVSAEFLCVFDGTGAGSLRGPVMHYFDMVRGRHREKHWATGNAVLDILLTSLLAVGSVVRYGISTINDGRRDDDDQ